MVRGSVDADNFMVVYTGKGGICAALSLNWGREMTIARRMIGLSARVE